MRQLTVDNRNQLTINNEKYRDSDPKNIQKS